MAYTAFITKAVGDPVIAADWNTYIRDNGSYFKDVFDGNQNQALVFANSLTVKSTAGGAQVEVGNSTVAGSAYVDFHSAGLSEDYNARIISTGGSSGAGTGDLTISANSIIFGPSTGNGPQFPSGNYMLSMKTGAKRRVEVGTFTVPGVGASANSTGTPVSFANAYSTGTPRVYLTPDASFGFGVAVASITTTGFTGFLWNANTSTAGNITVQYLAVGAD